MVSVLTFRTSGQGSSPGEVYCVEALLLQCPSPPRCIKGCDGQTSHPRGNQNTPNGLMLQKLEISIELMGHLACMQTLPTISEKCSP